MRLRLGLVFAVCLFAQDKETMLGDQLASQIRKQSKPVGDDIREYVRRLATRVAPDSKWVVETIVREQSPTDVFAAWAPGHVFVSAHILVLARNEAELAGVLAHALSHRLDRSLPMPIVFGEGVNRAEEIRADREAVAKMAAAGYSPHALLDYVERVARPDPQRLDALKAAVAAVRSRAEWIENTSAFVDARAQARMFEPPKLPRERPSLQKKIR